MTDLKKQYMSTTPSSSPSSKNKKPIAEPRPSSSILLISPLNQILLLHRVKTSSSFPSAHVFPGGNLAAQDGRIPGPEEEGRHRDAGVYRMGAIRECFEESGILLVKDRAKGKGEGEMDGAMLDVGTEEREVARRRIHEGTLKFGEWVGGLGGVVDCDSLIPFTRWVTPPNLPKRFTTQMYIYFLPLSTSTTSSSIPESAITPIPTSDGGLEHTTAEFAPISHWLDLANKNEIILFPPQYYLMHLLSPFLSPPSSHATPSLEDLQTQRNAVLKFLSEEGGGNSVPWAEKVISPIGVMMTKDGKSVLGLDRSGPELEGKDREGDRERVVIVRFGKGGPRDVGVRGRRDVFEEEREGKGAVGKL